MTSVVALNLQHQTSDDGNKIQLPSLELMFNNMQKSPIKSRALKQMSYEQSK